MSGEGRQVSLSAGKRLGKLHTFLVHGLQVKKGLGFHVVAGRGGVGGVVGSLRVHCGIAGIQDACETDQGQIRVFIAVSAGIEALRIATRLE